MRRTQPFVWWCFRLVLMGGIGFVLSGCGTIYRVFTEEGRNEKGTPIYGGVRTDAKSLGVVTDTRGNRAATYAMPLTVTCVILDMPLSLVADTLALPYTIPEAAHKTRRGPLSFREVYDVVEFGRQTEQRERKLQTQRAFSAAENAIALYQLQYGRLPESLDELCPQPSRERPDRYYLFRDGWGRVIRYLNQTNHFELRSAGRDGRFETEDDAVSDQR
jgi:uncharacterized protein YceK